MRDGPCALHPAIRIVSLIVLAVLLAQGGLPELLAAVVLLLGFYTAARAVSLRSLGRMLQRMRWLLLSLGLLYLWFTPGQPLLPTLGTWSPTLEGLELGALRAGLLVALVGAVNLLLAVTPRAGLLSGIYWLAGPLAWLGLSRERLALRMVLVLETVPDLQPVVRRAIPAGTLTRAGALRRLAETAARLFEQTIERAQRAPCEVVEIAEGDRPPVYQWLYPMALGALLWWVG